MKRVLFVGCVALSVLGCNHDKATDAAPAATVAPSAAVAAPGSAAAGEASPAAVSPAVVAAIPAEEDFEPQATTSITAANAATELAALEKEIKQ